MCRSEPLPLLLVALAVLLAGWAPQGGRCAAFKRPRSLPPFITPCPADENLDKCGMEMAQKALPNVLAGDPEFGLPPLDPMVVPRVQVQQGGGSQVIELDMHDLEVSGMKDLSVTGYTSDLPNGRVGADIFIPRLQILTQYEVKGKLGAMVLQNSGQANITIMDAALKINCVFHLIDHDNIKYMHMDDLITSVEVSRVYFNMGRKFGGSPLLAEAINLFLNENWKEVLKLMGPPIFDTVKAMVLQMSDVIVDTVPYNYIFPGAVPGEATSR